MASSAAYVTGKLAELVGHASYVTALAIAKSMPGHKKKSQGEDLQLLQHGNPTVLPSMLLAPLLHCDASLGTSLQAMCW